MPKQRAPFDHSRYRELKAQGLSQREIAKAMQIPESTLRDNLKAQQQHGEGPPMTTQSPPMERQGIPMETQSPPIEQATAVSAGRATAQGDFSPPPSTILEVDPRPRYVDPPDLSDDLKEMLGWWRTRQSAIQQPTEKLERVTYHVEPKWIEAVRREADLTGDTHAAVVNRAFATYFGGKST